VNKSYRDEWDEIRRHRPKKENKVRSYLEGKIVLNSDEFEGLVDVFRTLLEWSNDLEKAKKQATQGATI